MVQVWLMRARQRNEKKGGNAKEKGAKVEEFWQLLCSSFFLFQLKPFPYLVVVHKRKRG